MGVHDLAFDVQSRVHIADRDRLEVLRLAGAGNEKDRGKTDK
jgi:hypothetical protein